MAITTALPIYKTTYDLLTVVTPLTANMPRAHKATLGKRLAEESMDLVVLIYRANSARDKAPHLQQLLERMQVVELLLRLIDFLLEHYGSVGRAQVEDFFGIGPATATRDFALYAKAHPGNAVINPTSKRWVKTDTFKSAFGPQPSGD